MPQSLPFYLTILLLFSTIRGLAQTDLYPGDVMVLAIATDLGACGLPPEADEFSFVCFKDIETGTTMDFTDNGWEVQFPGFWGDAEGTQRMTRTGATIPSGTVITVQAQNPAGTWIYRTLSPDNQWTFSDQNIPGGPFNMNNGLPPIGSGLGGDQIYLLQGGNWNNQGGGINKSIYDGRILWAANTGGLWTSDGTVYGSNLHPDVIPCYYSQQGHPAANMNFIEYSGPTSGMYWDGDSWEDVDHYGYFSLITSPSYWTGYPDCASFYSTSPNFSTGATIETGETMGLSCAVCKGCPGYVETLQITLPEDGTYNITYYLNQDTFTITGVSNYDPLYVTVTEELEFGIVSIEKVGGCTVYSDFFPPDSITLFGGNNPGVYTEIWVCSNYNGSLPLSLVLNGNPDPGGVWVGPEFNLMGGLWIPAFGPGLYTYIMSHGHGSPCMPPYDSASVRIHTIDPSESVFDISCDQNGTPNDITDDIITLTLTMVGDGFGADYSITVNSGTITPNIGLTGVPTVFTIGPGGSATGPDLTVEIWNLHPDPYPASVCIWHFPIPAPGFCSDPCDYDMEATVSGDEDICIKNCPDDPATITVETFGGTEPYKMDFSLSAPTYPTWNFNNVFIDPYTEIEICVQNVPAPIFNSFSNQLTIPEFLGGSQLTFSLLNVYDKYDCTSLLDNDAVDITVHLLPHVDTLAITLCSRFSTTVDLTEYALDISSEFDVTWYDGNPLQGGEELANATSVNLNNVGQLWAHVMDDYCENAIRVLFTILPSPNLDSIPPVEICTGSPVILQSLPINDPGNSMAVYSFHINAPYDSSTILNPALYLPVDSTTVFLLATAGICFDTLPIDINVQDYPDFLLQATPCDLLLNTYSIHFTSSADSIVASSGSVMNNPTGQDAINGIPNNVNVTIEILNSTSLCKDTFLIVAPNCNCPAIAQPIASSPSYEICDGSAIPVMSVSVGPGMIANWYNVPSGGVPLLQNSLTYQPANNISASFYAESLDPANGCFSIRTEIPYVVHPVAILQTVADQIVCEGETINLNTLVPGVLNGVPGAGGWFDLTTNLPASGTLQPQNGNAWYYLFNSNPGSCQSSDTIAATVHPLPVLDIYTVVCDETTLTYVLSFTSDAENIIASGGSLIHSSGTDSFSLIDIPFDTDIQFDLENVTTGCTNTIIQLAPDCSCPALLQQASLDACSDQGNVDLALFEGFGVTGTWELVSSPSGGNPATLTGSNFQGQDADAGLYTLRFIRSIILTDCIDTATFQITLFESPFADAGLDAMVCAPDDIVLSGNAGGSNTQFLWQTGGSGSIINPSSLNITYTPTLADISAGAVTFTLSSTDQTAFCPNAQESIEIVIDGSAYYILSPATQTYCDTANILVDFDALISFGNTSGKWFFPDTVSAPIIGNSQFNPSSLQAGIYTVFYTTTNAVLPCENDTTGVNLIIENCLCPSVALSVPIDPLCSDAGSTDLNDFLITNESGTWSLQTPPAGSQPATISGSNFITSNSDDGIYRLRFTLSNPVAGCDDFAEINIQVIETPSLQISSVECADDLQSWEAIVVSTAEDVINSLGTITSLGNDRYHVQGILLSTNLQLTVSNGNGMCTSIITVPSPDCACTLNISNLPDDVVLCPDETILLDANVAGGKGAVTEFWIVANDSLYQNTLNISQAGSYQFVSFDELGCKEEHIVNVGYYSEMVPDISLADINCPGDKDGMIILHGIAGGNSPFNIILNDGVSQPIAAFPYQIDNLSAGNYKVDLVDAFNCAISVSVMIQSASTETVSLGSDQTILVGDSLLINPLISFVPDSFYWTGDTDILNIDLTDNWVAPETDKSIVFFAIDDKGCVYSDDINIKVLLTSSIFVPTIFSPNGDGNNDVIGPMTDPSIVSIEYFEIFSRWGEVVYSQKNFIPGQGIGWDGMLKQKPLSPGVFAYRLSATNKRGKVFTQYGDLTLIR